MQSKNIRVVLLVSLALAFAPVSATLAQSKSLIFERADIRIDSPAFNPEDKNAKPPHAPVKLEIELRGEDALTLEYIHTLNTLDGTHGVMIAFNSPAIAALPAMKVYTPVDVLFVADDGTLLQISPSIVLGEMTQTIQAFLFMQSGAAAAYGLHPRDTVTGHMFFPPAPSQE
jgi:hypothetical protein